MKCNICANKTHKVFSQKILMKYECQYFHCGHCGFLHTEKPYWLDEAYSNPIADADTGLVQRNTGISRRLSVLLYYLFGHEGHYVDFAGGTGLLVRMMRDIGFDFYWRDPYSTNVHARGFEFYRNVSSNAITAFEVLEHLEDPISFINEALNQADSRTLIFSTEVFADTPPSPGDWWYYVPETGQHIAFYQYKTLMNIAHQLGLRYFYFGDLHVMTDRSPPSRLFRLMAGRWSDYVFPYIRKNMRSKTTDDHRMILANKS